MSEYDDYFVADDKPFAENLNDALLVSNVFDLTVPIELPLMFRDSTWANSTSRRKCGVSVATLKSTLPSGVSISTVDGKSVLTGTGTVKLGFYPNFNSFGKYMSISWTGTGTINVNLKTGTGTTIASNINNGTISSESVELRKLQEIVIEIVLSNATLKTLRIVMENKQQERYGADVGITNVNGLETRLTSIESKDTTQDGRLDLIEAKDVTQDNRLSALETTDSHIFNYGLSASDYNPTLNGEITVSCHCTDANGNDVVGKSLTLYKNGESVSSATTQDNGVATWTVNCTTEGLNNFSVMDSNIQVNVKVQAIVHTFGYTLNSVPSMDTRSGDITISAIPTGWSVYLMGFTCNYGTLVSYTIKNSTTATLTCRNLSDATHGLTGNIVLLYTPTNFIP
ncbi:MAG: hypothetical protein J6Y78_12915 [Paludibacteraceae bacterium]|nr:hypothetical protein [Paludibacteraceae bacterium]